jgi:hypothetical protein
LAGILGSGGGPDGFAALATAGAVNGSPQRLHFTRFPASSGLDLNCFWQFGHEMISDIKRFPVKMAIGM